MCTALSATDARSTQPGAKSAVQSVTKQDFYGPCMLVGVGDCGRGVAQQHKESYCWLWVPRCRRAADPGPSLLNVLMQQLLSCYSKYSRTKPYHVALRLRDPSCCMLHWPAAISTKPSAVPSLLAGVDMSLL